MASPFLRNFYLLKETRTMTPEVQQYLLAGFLLLAAVFAVPLLKRILKHVKKWISDRIPALVGIFSAASCARLHGSSASHSRVGRY